MRNALRTVRFGKQNGFVALLVVFFLFVVHSARAETPRSLPKDSEQLRKTLVQLYKGPKIELEELHHLRAKLGDEDADVRRISAMVLARAGASDEKVIAVLIDGLSHARQFDMLGGSGAARELVAIGEPAVDALIKVKAYNTLGKIGPDAGDALSVVKDGLSEKSMRRRVAAALALYQISGESKQSLPVLREALSHEDWRVRFQGVQAILQLNGDAVTLTPALNELLDDERELVSRWAQMALDSIDNSQRRIP